MPAPGRARRIPADKARRSGGVGARNRRDPGEHVGLPQRQQPLGLVGPGVHGGLGLRLAPEDPVVVAARADLGALSGIGGPHRIRQGRGQGHRKGVLL